MGRSFLAFLLATALAAGCTLDRAGLIDPAGGGSPAQGGSPATGGAGPGPTTTQGGGPTTTSVGAGPAVGGGGGVVNCADQPGYECVPIPTSTPGAFEYAAAVDNASQCPGLASTLQRCECSCDEGTIQCDSATLNLWSAAGCMGSPNFTQGTGCNNGPPGNADRWAQLDASVAGTCEPVAETPAPIAQTVCLLDPAVQYACPANEICVPSAMGASDSCVVFDDGQCPAEYSEASRWYESVTSCSCGCDATCDTANVFSHPDSNSCNDNPAPQSVTTTNCVELDEPNSIDFSLSGTCTAMATAMGTTSGRALCCRP